MAGHTEADFEATIEAHLLTPGWRHGSPADYNTALGFDPIQLVEFVQQTQQDAWARLQTKHGAAVVPKFTKRVADELDARGVSHVLRRGVRDAGERIQLAYFRPTSGLTPQLQ